MTHGAGLGLAIARQLARRMGGDMLAHSAGPGQGAVFTVHAAAGAAIALPVPAEGVRMAERIAIVEDERLVRELVAVNLRHAGYEIVDRRKFRRGRGSCSRAGSSSSRSST